MNETNEELKAGIKKLVAEERAQLVLFFRYLIEIEKREIFLEEGCSSLVDYCERVLGLCHGTALKRVWVARAAARLPLILDYLSDGRLHLTAVSLLVKYLTDSNHEQLLFDAVGKKEPELRWWLSKLFPERLPADWDMNGREKVVPLDGTKAKFVLVVDQEFIEQLERLKEIHKHECPDGNALKLLKKAVSLDLQKHDPIERAKRARKSIPKESKKESKVEQRRPSAAVVYDAHQRANFQCTFVSPGGLRCTERGGLELDHERAWAKGGKSDQANINVFCFGHNRWKGRMDFKTNYRRQV